MIKSYAIHNMHMLFDAAGMHTEFRQHLLSSDAYVEFLIHRAGMARRVLPPAFSCAACYTYKGDPFVLERSDAIRLFNVGDVCPIADVDVQAIVHPKQPGLAAQAVSFGKAMADWAKAGFAMASDAVVAERTAICTACPFWKGEGYAGMGKCSKCGCSGAKLKLATSSCPVGKWHAVDHR